MQSLRSLPSPWFSHERIGITVSMPPGPRGTVLDADRSDLDLVAVTREDDAIVVVSLGVDEFAEI